MIVEDPRLSPSQYWLVEEDPHCESCDRSIATRFGSPIPPQFCDSCEADFKREYEAAGGMIEEA